MSSCGTSKKLWLQQFYLDDTVGIFVGVFNVPVLGCLKISIYLMDDRKDRALSSPLVVMYFDFEETAQVS